MEKLTNIFKRSKTEEFQIGMPFNVQHVYHVGMDGVGMLGSDQPVYRTVSAPENQRPDRPNSMFLIRTYSSPLEEQWVFHTFLNHSWSYLIEDPLKMKVRE